MVYNYMSLCYNIHSGSLFYSYFCFFFIVIILFISNRFTYRPVNVKRRRWTEDELRVLFEAFGNDITTKVMPPGYRLREALRALPDRTLAQVRTQVHNYMKKVE